jgi:hypothetical protein
MVAGLTLGIDLLADPHLHSFSQSGNQADRVNRLTVAYRVTLLLWPPRVSLPFLAGAPRAKGAGDNYTNNAAGNQMTATSSSEFIKG